MQSNEQIAQVLDDSPLTWRYWFLFGLIAVSLVVEFFDIFIVSFLVAILGPRWSLTVGEISVVLISAGIGGIVGALLNGSLSDRFGRKWILILNTLLVALASGSVSLLADGSWQLFAVLRFFVGFGVAGVAAASGPLMAEFTPARHRTLVVGLGWTTIPTGTLVASVVAGYMLPVAGWRAVAALGTMPLIIGLIMVAAVPESARWLLTQGRVEQAQRSIHIVTGRVVQFVLEAAPAVEFPWTGYRELLHYPRSFWLVATSWSFGTTASYGVILWGPTALAQLLHLDVHIAARGFILVSLASIAGRIAFPLLAKRIGRVRSGQLMGTGAAIFLAAAGLFHAYFVFGMSAFLACIIVAALFYEGGWASVGPHANEVVPVSMSSRIVGVAQMGSGIGKIAGPAILAFISGTQNFVSPKTTADSVLPGFLFLAACAGVVAVVYTVLPMETNGRRLALTPSDDRFLDTRGLTEPRSDVA